MTLYRFVVAGTSRFPMKMLAISQAWPANLEAAEDLDYAAPTQHKHIALTLASFQRPSPALWAEAGWPLQRIES
jgi:hypothetical protein